MTGNEAATTWTRPAAIAEHEIVRGFGGVVPPVLAGFSLATIAALVTVANPPLLASWAIVGLNVTAFSMIYAMQFLLTALRYWSTPADRLAWHPGVNPNDDEALREERWQHAHDIALFRLYAHRGRTLYNIGIAAISVSLLLLVIPGSSPAPPLAEGVVVVTAALGVLGELTLVVGAYVPALRPRIWPDPRDVTASVAKSWTG